MISISYNLTAEQIALMRGRVRVAPSQPRRDFPPARMIAIPHGEWPAWARAIELLSEDADAGVGDTIARLLGRYGRGYKKSLLVIGVPCGCDERQAEYNAKYPYEKDLPSGEN